MNRVQRQSFDPNMFKSMNESSNEEDYRSNDNLVMKGTNGPIKVDMKIFTEHVKYFRQNANKKIDGLSSVEKEKFHTVVTSVTLLYDTPHYKNLFEIVEENFKDLDTINPGTVGGYFAGCIVKSKYPNNGTCSMTCMNAIPNPNSEKCDQAIINADFVLDSTSNKYEYKFRVLKDGNNNNEFSKPTIIYINAKSNNDFKGFNHEEKTKLRNMGATVIQMYGYSSESSNYCDIYDIPTNIDNIKTRNNNSINNGNINGNINNSDNGNTNWGFAIVIIIIIILILYFGYRFISNKSD